MSSYDVVVLGSGIAGLSAALAAHEAGLKPVILEKSNLLGGCTTNSYGLVWVGENHLQREAGLKDSRDSILRYMRYLGGGEHNEDRLTTFVDRSPAILKRFADWGIAFRLVRGVTDHYFGMAPGALEEGRTLEVELISGFDLGEWKDRIVIPEDVPCYVTAEEQVSWGGINRFSQWDQDIVRERKARDMRGKGLGLVCHFVKALAARKVPILTGLNVERLAYDGRRVTGVTMASGETISASPGRRARNRRLRLERRAGEGARRPAQSCTDGPGIADRRWAGAWRGGRRSDPAHSEQPFHHAGLHRAVRRARQAAG